MGLLKMRGVKSFLAFMLIILLPSFLFSLDKGDISQSITVGAAYYFPDNKGFELDGNFAPVTYAPIKALDDTERDLGSTWGGAELQGTYKISLSKDVLTGGSFLTKDNNIKSSLRFSLSPVSFEFGAESTLTPIAFLDFTLGSTVASGWSAIGAAGLALNNDPALGVVNDPFQGVLSQTWLAGTFKFDTAAVLSGDKTWKHIIILTSHKLTYKYFSAAGKDDSWVYQGSEGNKFNGFIYNHTSVLAYQMPLILDMAGFLVETETNLFDNRTRSTMDIGGWGSDFIQVRFGGIFNFTFNDQHSLAILPQFINRRRYTDSTVKASYYANRQVNTDSPTYLDFDRIAFNYTYKF